MATFAAGQTLTAAALNLLADRPFARLIQTTAQSIANNTLATIQFNNETLDSNGGHDNTTNNTRYTFQRAGKYFIAGTAVFVANATGYRAASWMLNGIHVSGSEGSIPAVNGVPTAVHAQTTEINVVAGDFLELRAVQTSGAALNTAVNLQQSSTMSVYYLGA